MRAFGLLIASALLSGCWATPFWVTGPYRKSLSSSDVQQIAAIGRQHHSYGPLTKVYMNAPDTARLEFRTDTSTSRSYARLDAVKRDGKWALAKASGSEDSEVEFDITTWGHHGET